MVPKEDCENIVSSSKGLKEKQRKDSADKCMEMAKMLFECIYIYLHIYIYMYISIYTYTFLFSVSVAVELIRSFQTPNKAGCMFSDWSIFRGV